jgi:hypothetical protein
MSGEFLIWPERRVSFSRHSAAFPSNARSLIRGWRRLKLCVFGAFALDKRLAVW